MMQTHSAVEGVAEKGADIVKLFAQADLLSKARLLDAEARGVLHAILSVNHDAFSDKVEKKLSDALESLD